MVKTADFESAYQCSNHCLGTKLFLFMKHFIFKKYKHTVFSNNEIKSYYKLIKLLKNNIICPKCKNYVNLKTHKAFKSGVKFFSYSSRELNRKGLFTCKCFHTSFNEAIKSLCLEFQIFDKIINVLYTPTTKAYRIRVSVSLPSSTKFEDYQNLINTLCDHNLYDDLYGVGEKFNFCQIKNRVNKLLSFLYKLEQNMLFL